MKVASIQMAVENSKEANLAKAADKIEKCSDADLIILPEIWNVGFTSFAHYKDGAEGKEGKTLTMLQTMAEKTKSYIHSGSFVEKDQGNYYNSSYLISPEGEVVGQYRKIHLFGYKSEENIILTPGENVTVVPTALASIGMATCFDLRFPELFRKMVDKGAELFLVCSAWPYPRLEAWTMLNRVRALENQCFLVSSNSCGVLGETRFVGHSLVVDPWGEIIAGCGDEEVTIRTEIDLETLKAARDTFPGLASRVSWLG